MKSQYISRRYFRDLCDRVLDFLDQEPRDHEKALSLGCIHALEPGSLIYLSPKADQKLFFERIFPRIDVPVFLMTGGTGHPNPAQYGGQLEATTSRGEPLIAAWFCENKDRDDPRLVPIPIGVRQVFEAVIPELQEQSIAYPGEKKLVCANFDPATSEDRRVLQARLAEPSMGFVEELAFAPRETYGIYRSLIAYKFAFSPPGKGVDTYRCYEYLYLGIIPIMKRSQISCLFDELPVLIVDDWNEISEERLLRSYAEIGERFGFSDAASRIEFVRTAAPLQMAHHVERIDRVIRESGIPHEPLALDLDYLESEERRLYKRVFDGWYAYDPKRDPQAPAEPAAGRSTLHSLFKQILYNTQSLLIDLHLPGWLLDRLYRYVYLRPLPNGSAFSPNGYRTLKLLSRIVLRRHASPLAALASLREWRRAVAREDNSELAPDWILAPPTPHDGLASRRRR